ncbi:MAG: prolipoprotein diacylglyceryl transferase [Firmicutes bacterium]|nr:prolipoprotein diacylglyceryl transferase [Bacillota bacterium]
MHPIAFKIGNFPIYYYGVMMVVSYIVTLIVMKYTHDIEKLTYDEAVDVSIYSIAGGVIGARLFYVCLNLGTFLKSPIHILYIREGGLSWHGAMIGGFLGLFLMSYLKKIPMGRIADYASVHGTLALAIGRLGCFMNGCCYGKECSLPWAVNFHDAGIHGLRHPTQLYETLMLVVCFFLFLWWWKKKKFDGEMTLLMFAAYGVIRFVVEFFRENTANQYPGGIEISLAQYFSLAIIIVCAALLAAKRRKARESGK